jgi:hypothetical protein
MEIICTSSKMFLSKRHHHMVTMVITPTLENCYILFTTNIQNQNRNAGDLVEQREFS